MGMGIMGKSRYCIELLLYHSGDPSKLLPSPVKYNVKEKSATLLQL